MKRILQAVAAFCLVIGLQAVSAVRLSAQTPPLPPLPSFGQVLVDEIHPENTAILEQLAPCLPPHDGFAASTHYTVLSAADVAKEDGSLSRFYYVQVYFKDSDAAPMRRFFQSLVEVNSANECIAHIKSSSIEPLSDYIPMDVAVEFTRSRFIHLQQYRPDDFQETVSYYAAGQATQAQAFEPSDNVAGCQVLAIDYAALQTLGVSVSPSCQVVERFVFERGGRL